MGVAQRDRCIDCFLGVNKMIAERDADFIVSLVETQLIQFWFISLLRELNLNLVDIFEFASHRRDDENNLPQK